MHWFIEIVGKSEEMFVPHIYLLNQKQEAGQEIILFISFQSSCDGGFDCFMSPIVPEDAADQ